MYNAPVKCIIPKCIAHDFPAAAFSLKCTVKQLLKCKKRLPLDSRFYNACLFPVGKEVIMKLNDFKEVIKTSLTEGDNFMILDITFTMKNNGIQDSDILSLVNACIEEIAAEFRSGSISINSLFNTFSRYASLMSVMTDTPQPQYLRTQTAAGV